MHVCDLLLTFSPTRVHWKVLAYTSPTYLPDIYLIDDLYIVYDWLTVLSFLPFSHELQLQELLLDFISSSKW